MSYLITSNLLYYHDGDKWVTRPWSTVLNRYHAKEPRGSGGGGVGYAATAAAGST